MAIFIPPVIVPPQNCRSCGKTLALGTRRCPECGTELPRPSGRQLWVAVGLGLMLLAILAFTALGGAQPRILVIVIVTAVLGGLAAALALWTRK